MALLTDWLNGDNWATIKSKFSDLLNSYNGLAGGSTDQVLAKNSGSDFDYKWVTPPDAPDYDPGVWRDITFNSGYTTPASDSSSGGKFQYRKDSFDRVYFKGQISVGSIATNEINSVAIDSDCLPSSPKVFTISNYGASPNNNPSVAIIETDGTIKFVNMNGGGNVGSGSLSYFDVINYSVNE